MAVAQLDAPLGRVLHTSARIRVAAIKPTLAVSSAPQGTVVVVAAVSTTHGDGRTERNDTVVASIRRTGIARTAVWVIRTALEAGRFEIARRGHHMEAHAVGIAITGLAFINIIRAIKLDAEATGGTLVAVGVFAKRTRARTVSVNLAWPAPCSTYGLAVISARRLCARNAVRADGTGATAATSRITVTVEVSTIKVFTIVVHAGTGFDVLPRQTGANAPVRVAVVGHEALAVGGTFRVTKAIAFA